MTHNHSHAHLAEHATKFALAVAFILVVAKVIGWVMTDSVALLSSLTDSFLDVLASGLNFLALRYSLKPADEEHRFGHGKAEDIAGLAQAAFIMGSALLIGMEAGLRLMHPVELDAPHVGMNIMTFSLVLTIALVMYQRYAIRRTESVIVHADSLHYLGDILQNAGVLLSFWILHEYKLWWVDSVFGFAIAIYIIWSAWHIGKRAFDNLMDTDLGEELRQKVQTIVQQHADVKKVHNIRTRKSGMQKIIQCDIQLDPAMTLERAHQVAHEVEESIEAAIPGAQIFIHQEPA